MDMIESAKNALNNLKYVQARNTVREVLGLGRLKRMQEIAALQVASAAFFPEDIAAREPDSAAKYLKRLARMMPSGPLPADIASPALDSQLVAARRANFGATVRPPLEISLRGNEKHPAIDVIATQPARWQLYLISGDGGAPILLDTLPAAVEGKLSLTAHNGSAPVMQPGALQFRVLSISTVRPDTIVMRLNGTATGATPTLVDMPPVFDTSRLLPERATRALITGVVSGLVVGGMTWALANSVRPPRALAEEPKDGRGLTVALGIAVGAIAAGFLDKGKPLPANVRANAAMKAGYIKQLGDATEANRRRISEYKLAITVDPEIR